MSNNSSSRILAAIMFADIVGYTAMMQKNESHAKQLRDRHREVIEHAMRTHGGEIIQYYGDGTLSIFHSAKEAVLCAKYIQSELCSEPVVPLRIGIHVGDIVRDDAGIYGDGVNVAARIESLAITGGVLFSDRVFRELENHPSINTVSLGEFQLKNVKRPVAVYALDDPQIAVPTPDEIISHVHKKVNKSIAVLPFVNMSPGQESEYFTNGVAEDIMAGMTQVNDLSIISRTTCLAINKKEGETRTSAQRLNITHLLEGSVRHSGERVRVSVQLSNTSDGHQIWAEVFDRDLTNIFDVQDEIAQSVVNALKVSFSPPDKQHRIVSKPTQSLDAYKLFLKGMHHWNKGNPESVRKASEIFDEALTLDAQYSAAQCALSHCHAFLGSCGVINPTDAYAKALNNAMSAIESNPRNAEAHLAMANIKFYHFWDWAGTLSSLDKAESLGLNSALMHQSYGLYYSAIGQTDKGVAKMLKALELDPLAIPVLTMLGTLYIFDHRFDDAIKVYDEILDLNPAFRSAYEFKGVALLCKGLYDEALVQFSRYHEMVNHPQKGVVGHILAYHALGNLELANEYLGRIYQRLEEDAKAPVDVDLAIAHAGMGNHDQAIGYLNAVYEKRFSIVCMGMIWILRCPYFKDLRKEPEYKKLLVRMGLPTSP